jgi:hypothetical protein
VNFTTPAVTGVTQLWATPAGVAITAGQSTTSMTCNWSSAAGSVTVRSVNACGQSAAFSKSVALATCISEDNGNVLRDVTMEVYPNPSNGNFVIRSNNAGEYNLMNSIGQTIEVVKLNADNYFRYEISGLSAGVYFITGNVNGTTITERVVVTGN